jgi:hypothetical protein
MVGYIVLGRVCKKGSNIPLRDRERERVQGYYKSPKSTVYSKGIHSNPRVSRWSDSPFGPDWLCLIFKQKNTKMNNNKKGECCTTEQKNRNDEGKIEGKRGGI